MPAVLPLRLPFALSEKWSRAIDQLRHVLDRRTSTALTTVRGRLITSLIHRPVHHPGALSHIDAE